jgi:hypothetical protein
MTHEFSTEWAVALAIFVLAQLADIVTTRNALDQGGREANPISAWVMSRFGIAGWIWVKVLVAGIGAVLIVCFGTVWMLWALSLLLFFVALSNDQVAK